MLKHISSFMLPWKIWGTCIWSEKQFWVIVCYNSAPVCFRRKKKSYCSSNPAQSVKCLPASFSSRFLSSCSPTLLKQVWEPLIPNMPNDKRISIYLCKYMPTPWTGGERYQKSIWNLFLPSWNHTHKRSHRHRHIPPGLLGTSQA